MGLGLGGKHGARSVRPVSGCRRERTGHRGWLHQQKERRTRGKIHQRKRITRPRSACDEVYVQRRAGKSECRRQRPQEYLSRTAWIASAAEDGLYRFVLAARMGYGDSG